MGLRERFPETSWTLLARACKQCDEGARAREDFAQRYYRPVQEFLSVLVQDAEQAQDLAQEFFARLLEGNWLAKADRQRGRFRSFLLSAMKHFMANEWNKSRAQKRGGGQPILSLNDDSAEHRYRLEPAEKATPESLYERGWALTLLEGVLARLEDEYRLEGKQAWWESMRPALTTDRGAIVYQEMAQDLGITETAARVAVHRLRQRYRQLIRAEVAGTVASPEEVDEEMHHLFQVLTDG